MEAGWLKGQGREKEEKGKRKGREKEGKGNEKERESEGNYFNFRSFGSFRNGFEIPKQPKQTERGDYILSEKIPKQNRNCQCFGLFRFEPKEKKSVSQDTLFTSLRGFPLNWEFLSLFLRLIYTLTVAPLILIKFRHVQLLGFPSVKILSNEN